MKREDNEIVNCKRFARFHLSTAIDTIKNLSRWQSLSKQEQHYVRVGIVMALADLTAEAALESGSPTREQFMDFLARSYDHEQEKRASP